jgi:hypothetical protein
VLTSTSRMPHKPGRLPSRGSSLALGPIARYPSEVTHKRSSTLVTTCFWPLALSVAGMIACSSQTGGTGSTSGSGPVPTPTFGLTPRDAGGPDTDLEDASPDVQRSPRKEGAISIALQDLTVPGIPSGTQGARVVAAFGDYAAGPQRCFGQAFGQCKVITCQYATDVVPGPHAGTLTISSSRANVSPVVLPVVEGGGGVYANAWSSAGVFALAGDTITVNASGSNDIPAFSTELRVDAPVVARITSLMARSFGDYLIDRSKDVELAWDGTGRTGELSLSVNQVREVGVSQYERNTIDCSFPAAQGTGAIPSAAFAQFFAGEATVLYTTVQRQTINRGGYAIIASVSSDTLIGFKLAVP